VFGNEVKLIKDSSYGSYTWSGYNSFITDNNVWSNSLLNINILNSAFVQEFENNWLTIISLHDWQVGGGISSNFQNVPKVVFQKEVKENDYNNIYKAKIGLMYISDYGYSCIWEYWENELSNYDSNNIKNNNWLYSGISEWTISPGIWATSGWAFNVNSDGNVEYSSTIQQSLSVRPCFYLNPDVKYFSGSGTESDPIHLKLN